MENKNDLQTSNPVRQSLEVTIKVGLVIGLIVWCFMILKPFLMIILWGVILAVAVYPLFKSVTKWLGNSPKIAAVVVTVLLLAMVLLPGFLLGGSLADAIAYIREAFTSGKSMIPPPNDAVKSWPLVGPKLYETWNHASSDLADTAMDYREQLMAAASWFLTALTQAGVGVVMFIFSILVSGFFLIFSDTGADAARKIAVRLMGELGEETVANAELTIRNVARGILGVAFIQAFLAGIGFLVAGVPGAGLWALIGFFLAVVQIGVGPVVIIACIWAFFNLSLMTAILLTVWCAPLLVIDNILKPILLARGAPVPMLVIFLGAIGGFISFGTIGLFVGAVVLSLGYNLFMLWLEGNGARPSPDSTK